MLSRVLQVGIMAMALAAASAGAQEPPPSGLAGGEIVYYLDAQGKITAMYGVAGKDLIGFFTLSLQDKRVVFGGEQQRFSQFLQFSPEVQKVLGCEKLDGKLGDEALNKLYHYILKNPSLSVGGRTIAIKRIGESNALEAGRIFYAIIENNIPTINDMPAQLDKNIIKAKIDKIIKGSGYLPQDKVLVLLRDQDILRYFKIVEPGMGSTGGSAPVPVTSKQKWFFGLVGVLAGGVFLFVMLMLRGPRQREWTPPSLRNRQQNFPPLGGLPPQSTGFPPPAAPPFEVKGLEPVLHQALKSWADELTRRWAEPLNTLKQEIRQESQARLQALASRVDSQAQVARDLTLKTAAIQEDVQTLLARVPEPPPEAALSADERQRWEQALEFGRKFREWLAVVRKQQDLTGEPEARGFFSRFWETCLAEKVGEFVGGARLMVQSAHLPASPPDLEAGLRGVLFGCLSPALVLVFRLNFLIQRRGGALAPAALSAFATLKNDLDACLELLAAPPFHIQPLKLTPLRPCDDRFMQPLEGNILEYLPNFQEKPGRQKVILDVWDWAFLQDGTLLDGRRAKVVHG